MELNWKEELGEELQSEFLDTTLKYQEQVLFIAVQIFLIL